MRESSLCHRCKAFLVLTRPSLPSSAKYYALVVRRQSTASKSHDPLRMLFCGADEFSIHSLRALHELSVEQPKRFEYIDVACRPDKLVGRGLKRVQEVPVKGVARSLGLDLHQFDTFKNWDPPRSYNLVVAVSFGLLVPPRILNAAKYGGLNLHPSMLPDLRGPAPIHYTLLKRRRYCGVSLQTMHPQHFDQGTVLAQTPAPGLPVPDDCTPEVLMSLVYPLAAQMLKRGIEDGVFVPPVSNVRQTATDSETLEHAPKITTEDGHIDWTTWTADEINLRTRVLGRVWDDRISRHDRFGGKKFDKRIVFEGHWRTAVPSTAVTPGEPVCVMENHEDAEPRFGIGSADGLIMLPTSATIDGGGKGKGLRSMVTTLMRQNSNGVVEIRS